MTQLAKRGNLLGMPSLFNGFFDDDRWFNPDVWNGWKSSVPAANVSETEDEFHIDLAAPGMDKKDFHVNFENGVLYIKSEKEDELKKEEDGYTRQEFSYSSFSRSFLLPDGVNEEMIHASYKDGILSLSLPKKEEAKKVLKKEIAIS